MLKVTEQGLHNYVFNILGDLSKDGIFISYFGNGMSERDKRCLFLSLMPLPKYEMKIPSLERSPKDSTKSHNLVGIGLVGTMESSHLLELPRRGTKSIMDRGFQEDPVMAE